MSTYVRVSVCVCVCVCPTQVVLSIAISVLSALTFLAASAADATGTFMIYMVGGTHIHIDARRHGYSSHSSPTHFASITSARNRDRLDTHTTELRFQFKLFPEVWRC